MPNRVMQAKELKRIRPIRRLPKRMPGDPEGRFNRPDYVPDKFNPDIPARLRAEGMVAPRQPTRELMQGYQHRAKSLAKDDKPGRFKGVTPARKEVEASVERIQTRYSVELSFTLLDTRTHRARVFFNSQRTVYVLLYENYKMGVTQHSLPHCDKKELVDRFRTKRLTLVEYQSSG